MFINLYEKNRTELLSKERQETPKRVLKSKNYSISNIIIDPEAFINNWLVISTNISGNGSTYLDNISFKNVITNLINICKNDTQHYVNSKLIQKSLKQSLDKNDIYIDCSCPDFKYRYAYHATQGKFKWGTQQHSNGKKIRNPNNDKGSMCKHLYALLHSNVFLNKISDKIMKTVMANLDILVKKYNINLDEFILNTTAYDRLKSAALSRTSTGRFVSTKNQEVDENDIN